MTSVESNEMLETKVYTWYRGRRIMIDKGTTDATND